MIESPFRIAHFGVDHSRQSHEGESGCRTIKKSPTHLSTAIGSLTERGEGNARTSSGLTVAGPAVACASNVVAYEDGRAAAIADGSTAWIVGGFDLADYGDFKRLASVGIELDSGDVIFHVPERERLASGSWLRVVKQPGAMRRGEVT